MNNKEQEKKFIEELHSLLEKYNAAIVVADYPLLKMEDESDEESYKLLKESYKCDQLLYITTDKTSGSVTINSDFIGRYRDYIRSLYKLGE